MIETAKSLQLLRQQAESVEQQLIEEMRASETSEIKISDSTLVRVVQSELPYGTLGPRRIVFETIP